MPCLNCLDNCDPLVSDKCVKYTGMDIESLGILKGMSLFEIEKVILDKLTNLSGPSVKLDTITTTCSFITDLLFGKTAQPFTLQQFAEIVFDGFCKLNVKINSTTPAAFSFNVSCLTGTLDTKDKIIQAIIDKVCDVNTRLTAIESKYVTQTSLCAQVQTCLTTIVPTYKDRMVPFTYIPYAGPLSNFDSTGKGLVNTGFTKIYLANGLNNTQDWRGRSPIGSVLNVPGTTLDTIVSNAAYNYASGAKYGLAEVSLNVNQNAPHSHTINDPGHTHNIPHNIDGGNTFGPTISKGGTPDADPWKTDLKLSDISINSSGNGAPHNNIQPSIACLYIVYIP